MGRLEIFTLERLFKLKAGDRLTLLSRFGIMPLLRYWLRRSDILLLSVRIKRRMRRLGAIAAHLFHFNFITNQ